MEIPLSRAPILIVAVLPLLGHSGSAILLATPTDAATFSAKYQTDTRGRPSPSVHESHRLFLDRYCVTCHNPRLATAGLVLDDANIDDASESPEVWEKVVRKLRSGVMPPAGARRPDDMTLHWFAGSLEAALDRAAAARPNPGRSPLRRLNRTEYTNAIRDLLSVEIDGPALLPGDDAGYGFDNIADLLSVSTGLLSRYLSAAQKIARLAVGTPGAVKIFVCRPVRAREEEPCARKILTTLARRAYRRPVHPDDIQLLLGFYRDHRSDGGFNSGIQAALERLLVDPEFLFRIERDPADVPPGTAYRVSDVELASRLSFFLWSSIPDDELLGVAERGRLKDPSMLEQQVRRMLADTRSTALVNNFAAQWLHLRNMRTVKPDHLVFPEFDESLREAFVRETELFLESQLRGDRSVVDLLSANYTFVNDRLARHYGIPNVQDSDFRRLTFDDGRRGGLLGQGSLLTVTSYADRTSPVVRGKWLLENVLGAPPPPPPPDVPCLQEVDDNGKPRSVREQMEQHRKNPSCASCHVRMDPLGFALENFDGIGGWRDVTEAGSPVDSSGTLPDGTRVDGAAGLRRLVVGRREEFVGTFSSKLLTYALGRGPEPYDAPAVRAIVRAAARDGDRWSSIVLAIARSTPFQMRMRPPRQPSPPPAR